MTSFREAGAIMIPRGVVFDDAELEYLIELQQFIPEEHVQVGDVGDTHDLYIRRFMHDRAGEVPERVHQPYSDQILDLLSDERRTAFFTDQIEPGAELFIRRAQYNRLVRDSFVGMHVDADSNPGFALSVVVQLGREFGGGEFVAFPEGRPEVVLEPTFGSVILLSPDTPHEVRPVKSDQRVSLAYFYGRDLKPNPRPATN
jgi:hypothetical protein